MPKVSIIIPCYNDGEFINEAVDSVLCQTYKDFEIIIVNDGSTDLYTNNLLEKYCKPMTKVIWTDNIGPASARNLGITHATGDFILPLDADDKIGNTYLEKSVPILLQHPDIGIVYCKANFFGNKTGNWSLPAYSLNTMLFTNVIFCTALFRKVDWQKVGGYNPNMIYGYEDYDFWLSLISNGLNVYQIPETLFYYRKKDISRTTLMDGHRHTEMYLRIFRNHKEFYANNLPLIYQHICQLHQIIHQLNGKIKEMGDLMLIASNKIEKLICK